MPCHYAETQAATHSYAAAKARSERAPRRPRTYSPTLKSSALISYSVLISPDTHCPPFFRSLSKRLRAPFVVPRPARASLTQITDQPLQDPSRSLSAAITSSKRPHPYTKRVPPYLGASNPTSLSTASSSLEDITIEMVSVLHQPLSQR